jgi:threonine dehydratase
MTSLVGLGSIEDAARRLKGVIRPTPALYSSALSKLAARPVFVKPEHFQRTGSFKIRGAYNRISVLAAEGRAKEIVAALAGNHAQGVALAASLCRLQSTVFMPQGASLPKVEATRAYGADVRFEPGNVDDAITAARHYASERGAYYVPPFDDPYVIAGQGTIGLELVEEVAVSGSVLVPVGGGGLVAGIGAALHGCASKARVIGVEAAGAASMGTAISAGAPVELPAVETMADGIAVQCVSQLTFDHAEAFVDRVVAVTEEEISRAVLADKPGALATLTTASGRLGLNLLTVEHRRSGAPVGVSEVEVILTLETRDPSHRDQIVPSLQAQGFRAQAYRR